MSKCDIRRMKKPTTVSVSPNRPCWTIECNGMMYLWPVANTKNGAIKRFCAGRKRTWASLQENDYKTTQAMLVKR